MNKSEFIQERPFFYTGFAGVLVIVLSVCLLFTFPQKAEMPHGFKTPVIYFEFIKSQKELDLFFGISSNNGPNKIFIEKMDLGNKLDYAFMLAYSAFLFLFFRKLYRISQLRWCKFGMMLAVVALLGDFIENIQLLSITAKLESGDFSLNLILLRIFTWIKWGSLALSFMLLFPWLQKLMKNFRFFACLVFLPFILAAIAFVWPGFATELFSKSISLAFFVLICFCFLFKLKRDKETIKEFD